MKGEKDLFKSVVRKGFSIDLEEPLNYPSAQIICKAVEEYSLESKEQLEFESKVKPISFYLDNRLYQVEIGMARGGYIIHCHEI